MTSEIKMRGIYEQIYANKFNILHEIEKFF